VNVGEDMATSRRQVSPSAACGAAETPIQAALSSFGRKPKRKDKGDRTMGAGGRQLLAGAFLGGGLRQANNILRRISLLFLRR